MEYQYGIKSNLTGHIYVQPSLEVANEKLDIEQSEHLVLVRRVIMPHWEEVE